MEKENPTGSIDELALVKAAAWAWYQQGSGSEGRPMRESDLTRTENAPKPSRYKLEAMEDHCTQETDEKLSPPFRPLSSIGEHSDICLLDTYDIERISKQLNSYIESSQAEYYRSFLGSEQKGHRKAASLSGSGTSGKKSRHKNKGSKGFKWLVACGSSPDDVVQGRSLRIAVAGKACNGG